MKIGFNSKKFKKELHVLELMDKSLEAKLEIQNRKIPLVANSEMTLHGQSNCIVSGFSGNFYKVGKLIWFKCSFDITSDGSGEIVIDCLPDNAKTDNVFEVGYRTATFVSKDGVSFGCVKAGAVTDTKQIKLYGELNGRAYILKGTNLTSGGSIIISGVYLSNE